MGEVYLLTNLQMGYDVKQGFTLMKIKTDLYEKEEV